MLKKLAVIFAAVVVVRLFVECIGLLYGACPALFFAFMGFLFSSMVAGSFVYINYPGGDDSHAETI